MTSVPDFIKPEVFSSDKLDKLRAAVAKLRDMTREKDDLESRLTEINKKIFLVTREDLPELFSEAGVNIIGLDASGNQPAYTAKLETEVKASISVEWEPDRREAAFAYLQKHRAGDLIQAVVTIEFDKEQIKEAIKLRKELAKRKLNVDLDMKVHHATLSAWLRELNERHKVPPNIEVIGGSIGPVVKLKPVKSK